MILSQPELRAAVDAREIVFEPPLDERQWGEASVDLRLGRQFTMFKPRLRNMTISVADGLQILAELGAWNTKELRDDDGFGRGETFELEPGKLVTSYP